MQQWACYQQTQTWKRGRGPEGAGLGPRLNGLMGAVSLLWAPSNCDPYSAEQREPVRTSSWHKRGVTSLRTEKTTGMVVTGQGTQQHRLGQVEVTQVEPL